MSKLIISLKDGAAPLDLETTQKAAMRVLNRYLAFLRLGGDAPNRFVIDGKDAGVIGFRMETVQAIYVKKDE